MYPYACPAHQALHLSHLSRNTKNVVYEPVPMAHVDVVDTVQGCAMEPLEGAAKILGETLEWRG